MQTFSIKWKRKNSWFWKTEKKLTGVGYSNETDRYFFYYMDGTIKEVAKWSDCDCKLGLEWLAFQKKKVEKEAGQPVAFNV